MSDWSFYLPSAAGWSAIIAVVALLNSEFHFLSRLIARSKLDWGLHSKIAITHTAGIPNVTALLLLHNEGNRTLTINSVTLNFKRDNLTFALQGDMIALKVPQINVLLTPFKLRPGLDWTQEIIFCEKLTRREDERLRNLKSDIRNDINTQINARTEQERKESPPKLMEADPVKVSAYETFAREKFKWEAGDYKMIVNVATDTPDANVSKTYRFTIFENEANNLKQFFDKYKFGLGVYYFNNEQEPLQVEIEVV